ncbi:MAG TPA: DegT/DnrJ/EryC1/StrS family aminotransferase [Acidimicrobiales bacterium]|nr:DegT/DnrJ/EryC1/StrS family aminotransferase [Acidimicrobiales bacterium]
MKRAPADFAILGGKQEFSRPLPVGQLYFPSWDRYEAAMRSVFDAGRFTGEGPLVRELEERLAAFFGVRHTITVTNATIGLMMAAKALGLTGRVVVPSFTFVASAQALTWAGLDVAFCDVDPRTHQLTPETVAPVLESDVTAVLGVNLWGGSCDPAPLEAFARDAGVKLFFDSAHGAGVTVGGVSLGGFGEMEIFSFHATKVLSATEGGCICTNDDDLAARVRELRGGHPSPMAELRLRCEAPFSEAQAAIALMSLEDLPRRLARNERLVRAYASCLAGIPGIRVVLPTGADRSNYQYGVVEVDETRFGMSRDALAAILAAENVVVRRYFHPGVHRSVPYRRDPRFASLVLPHTERLCETLLQLPVGALVDARAVGRVAALVEAAHRHAGSLVIGAAA